MRLGELLAQKGLVSHGQVETALQAQKRYGRRLGTNLIQLGYVTLDAVALALSDQFAVPPVLREHVAAIDPKTLALVPARIVTAQRAVPIGYTLTKPARLVVACERPGAGSLEDLAFASGRRIEAWVAPEMLLQECLEKYFGARPIPSPYISIKLAAQGTGANKRASVPPPSNAGPSTNAPVPAPPPSRVRVTLEMPERPPAPAPAPLVQEAPVLSPPPSSTVFKAWSVLDEPVAPPEPVSAPPEALRPLIDRAEASRLIEMATSKDQIGSVLEDWLRSTFGCGLVLVVKGDMALGWKGFFPDADDLVEAVAIPLGKPNVFATVSESHAPFLGAPPAEGAKVHERLWKLLRCPAPAQILVCPIAIGKRAVNLVYGQMDDGTPIAQRAVEDAVALAREAGAAYARLIEAKKR